MDTRVIVSAVYQNDIPDGDIQDGDLPDGDIPDVSTKFIYQMYLPNVYQVYTTW